MAYCPAATLAFSHVCTCNCLPGLVMELHIKRRAWCSSGAGLRACAPMSQSLIHGNGFKGRHSFWSPTQEKVCAHSCLVRSRGLLLCRVGRLPVNGFSTADDGSGLRARMGGRGGEGSSIYRSSPPARSSLAFRFRSACRSPQVSFCSVQRTSATSTNPKQLNKQCS